MDESQFEPVFDYRKTMQRPRPQQPNTPPMQYTYVQSTAPSVTPPTAPPTAQPNAYTPHNARFADVNMPRRDFVTTSDLKELKMLLQSTPRTGNDGTITIILLSIMVVITMLTMIAIFIQLGRR